MNGDILFGPRLIELCQVPLEHIEAGLVLPRVLLTGRRYNADMPYPFDPLHTSSIPKGVPRKALQQHILALHLDSALFQSDAFDYFFISRGAYDWNAIPDFVPGRRIYDNFLVDHAYRDMVERVDMTRCVFAIHQSGSDGNQAGQSATLEQPDFNVHAAASFLGGHSRGHTYWCNISLKCPLGGAIRMRRHPWRQRSGERGPPWTGQRRPGVQDPLTGVLTM
jgi:hypothetical protein